MWTLSLECGCEDGWAGLGGAILLWTEESEVRSGLRPSGSLGHGTIGTYSGKRGDDFEVLYYFVVRTEIRANE
jgi:hypothetical protein